MFVPISNKIFIFRLKKLKKSPIFFPTMVVLCMIKQLPHLSLRLGPIKVDGHSNRRSHHLLQAFEFGRLIRINAHRTIIGQSDEDTRSGVNSDAVHELGVIHYELESLA